MLRRDGDLQTRARVEALLQADTACCYRLAQKARARDATAPASDVLIAACAQFHGVPLEHSEVIA